MNIIIDFVWKYNCLTAEEIKNIKLFDKESLAI